MSKTADVKERRFSKALDTYEKSILSKGYSHSVQQEFLKACSDFCGVPVTIEKLKEALDYIEGQRSSIEASEKRLNDKKMHINRAIDILTLTGEGLKSKETLNNLEIRKLSKTLREAVEDIFYFIGVAPQAIEKCYEMTAKYLKKTPEKERIDYLPIK